MNITQRNELKYKISYTDYHRIKPLISTFLQHDKRGEEDAYPVHSIYLDDIYHSGAMDKAFGNRVHLKYRIRHYQDETKKQLELKERIGILSKKISSDVDDTLYHAICSENINSIEQRFHDALIRRFTLDNMRYHFTPYLCTLYKREAFSDEMDHLRVTFDHDLQVKQFDPTTKTEYVRIMDPSHLIMEIKYEEELPNTILDTLKLNTLEEIPYSKYFMGYSHLHL